MEKELIIDAICGTYPPTYSSVIQHLVEFTGDQWNEDWEWKREELEKLSCAELEALYRGVKDKSSELYKEDLVVTLEPNSILECKTAAELLDDLFTIVSPEFGGKVRR